ncbi:substrate for poxvirus S-S bond formation pathway [Murmansk poxvirus]|uniref:Substrate for poxvirus S-S bond formation pathway n=1 Tax=Murmansk poxvirus TaxID=2025359 RepID=A0A223FMM8_9POXV|nr:substrate for poxvirus S-S bond formation pathway [Murmansk poxvirus]AST09238.1 substrate for poxvirus S-S bond formation pathway [Murmansk poxvirus]
MAETKEFKTLYNLFIDRYLQKLAQHSIPTNISCAIHIGEIIGKFKNCALRITNKCMSNSKLSFTLMIESFIEVVALLPEKDRKAIAEEIGIDLNDPPNAVSRLERNCNASADVSNIVDIQEFNVGECQAPPGQHILLQIINTGSAEANCGLQTIIKSLNKVYVPNTIDNRLPFYKPWFIAGVVIILVIFAIAVCCIRRKLALKYRYGTFLYV